MDIYNLINQVGILFIIIIIGIIARKKNIINDETKKGLTEIIIKIAFPCMVVTAFNQQLSPEMLKNAILIMVISFVIHAGSFIVSKFLYNRYPDDMISVMRYGTVFSNSAFMGYPVIEGLFGSIGVFYVSMYSIPYRILMWTLGVALFQKEFKKNDIKEIFLNPGILSICVGIVVAILPFELPIMVTKTFNMVGSTATPLSMIMIGVMLADVEAKNIFTDSAVFYNSAVRLIILPLICLAVLKIVGADPVVQAVVVLLTAMPIGSMAAILAGRYNANEGFASKCVFISTTLSLVTIPLIALMI